MMKNECWGIEVVNRTSGDQVLMACGAGIEIGACSSFSGQEQTDCNAGLADQRGCYGKVCWAGNEELRAGVGSR